MSELKLRPPKTNKCFLQGLKPLFPHVVAPGLKPRPPKEKIRELKPCVVLISNLNAGAKAPTPEKPEIPHRVESAMEKGAQGARSVPRYGASDSLC